MKNAIILILLILVLGLGYIVLKPNLMTQPIPAPQTTNSLTPTQPQPAAIPTPVTSTSSTTVSPQFTTYAHLPLLPSFIGGQEGWPPVFTRSSASYKCDGGRTGMGVPTTTKERIVNGRVYCVKTNDEGAAGTIYYTYTYTTVDTTTTNSSGTLTTHFTLAFHDTDCTKVGTAENISCNTGEPSWSVDAAVASILK